MPLAPPSSLSPSKVAAFKSCPLAFRFSAIDRIPEPPSPQAVKGTLVHKALEGLFWSRPPGARSPEAAVDELRAAWDAMADDPELTGLGLDEEEAADFVSDAEVLVRRYFEMEDPDAVRTLGVELTLEARIGRFMLRGIIDRLELTSDGELLVTDYKTGRAPSPSHQQTRLDGVHFYAYLCERVLGKAPARVQLLFLRDTVAITSEVSGQSLRGAEKRALAVWSAIEQACRSEDFRPRPSGLCSWCSFKPYCPAFGGDPGDAPVAGSSQALPPALPPMPAGCDAAPSASAR